MWLFLHILTAILGRGGVPEDAVQKVPQVLACFLVAGENDYLLRIAAQSVNDFSRIHTTYLSALPHVLRMESNFVMRTVMNRGLNAEDI